MFATLRLDPPHPTSPRGPQPPAVEELARRVRPGVSRVYGLDRREVADMVLRQARQVIEELLQEGS